MSSVVVDLLMLEPGDLILTCGTGTISKLLRVGQMFLNATTRSHYSHASVYLGGGHIFEATLERGVSIGSLIPSKTLPQWDGNKLVLPVDIRSAGYEIFHVYRNSEVMVSGDSRAQLRKAVVENYGAEYATWLHFLRLVHQKIVPVAKVEAILKKYATPETRTIHAGQMFCSELATKVYESVGYVPLAAHAPSPWAMSRKDSGFVRVTGVEVEAKVLADISPEKNPTPAGRNAADSMNSFRLLIGSFQGESPYEVTKRIDQLTMQVLAGLSAADEEVQMQMLSGYSESLRLQAMQQLDNVDTVSRACYELCSLSLKPRVEFADAPQALPDRRQR